MTDDAKVVAMYEARYPGRVRTPPATRGSGLTGVHFERLADPRQLGIEVLRDVLVAIKCDGFLGTGHSNVSNFVALLRDWRTEECLLVGVSILGLVNPLPYDRSVKPPLELPPL
jgi:hypothetical protein